MSHETLAPVIVCACDTTPTRCPCPCLGCAVARFEALDAKLARELGLWRRVPRAVFGAVCFVRSLIRG